MRKGLGSSLLLASLMGLGAVSGGSPVEATQPGVVAEQMQTVAAARGAVPAVRVPVGHRWARALAKLLQGNAGSSRRRRRGFGKGGHSVAEGKRRAAKARGVKLHKTRSRG